MENWESFLKKLLNLIGFSDYRIEIQAEDQRGSIYIYDFPKLVQDNLPALIDNINHLASLVAKKNNQPQIFFDINNYRKERENLIAELARRAARKVLTTQERISLPAMNSYERRIVHTELAMHPGVATESQGVGRERFVIIKPLTEGEPKPAKDLHESNTTD